MKKRLEQMVSSMTGVLCNWFLEENAREFYIKVKRDDEFVIVTIIGDIDISPEKLAKIEKQLNQPKSFETEHYYSQLLDSVRGQESNILGKIIDDYDIKYDEDIKQLMICLKKKIN